MNVYHFSKAVKSAICVARNTAPENEIIFVNNDVTCEKSLERRKVAGVIILEFSYISVCLCKCTARNAKQNIEIHSEIDY